MRKLHIFIETSISSTKKKQGLYTNEYHFVEQYLKYILPDIGAIDYDITDVGGKDKLWMFDNAMKQNTEAGETNLVIFDCDEQSTGGGYAARSCELNSLQTKLGVKFDLFLFPNNKDEGAFEDLLLNIINNKHQGVLECFEGYEMCLRGHDPNEELYETPNKKAKIYSYITTFKHSRKENEKIKSGDWNFSNAEYWDLDSEYLEPLRRFIMKHAKSM